MGNERYPRGTDPQGDYYGRNTPQDYGQDYGSGREFGYSSARDFQAADDDSYDRDRSGVRDRGRYGAQQGSNRGMNQASRTISGRYDQGRQDRQYGDRQPYYGSYASDGHRFEDVGGRQSSRDAQRGGRGDYGRQPQGYDYQERGFFDRAGDEVRSWFGDDEAERRREMDQRYDNRADSHPHDADYHHWRRQQIDSLDRDYNEYRQENRQKFHNEFGTWRTERQGQRSSLNQVKEHMDVVGSDGEHVGTVDKVRGDRIILTKSDPDAGGHHHSIPSRWIDKVDDKVTIRKTADDAHAHWKDEERNQAMFGDDDKERGQNRGTSATGNLDRSFSGTY